VRGRRSRLTPESNAILLPSESDLKVVILSDVLKEEGEKIVRFVLGELVDSGSEEPEIDAKSID
jgi:hypothetical protein